MSQVNETRIPLHCACCGREILAELVVSPEGRKLVITVKRHGERHCVALPLPLGTETVASWEQPSLTTPG